MEMRKRKHKLRISKYIANIIFCRLFISKIILFERTLTKIKRDAYVQP